MAQRLARSTHNRQVPGSNPGGATKSISRPEAIASGLFGMERLCHAVLEAQLPSLKWRAKHHMACRREGATSHAPYGGWKCHSVHNASISAKRDTLWQLQSPQCVLRAIFSEKDAMACATRHKSAIARITWHARKTADMKKRPKGRWESLEATTGIEPVIKALQASALPLGHVAMPRALSKRADWKAGS